MSANELNLYLGLFGLVFGLVAVGGLVTSTRELIKLSREKRNHEIRRQP